MIALLCRTQNIEHFNQREKLCDFSLLRNSLVLPKIYMILWHVAPQLLDLYLVFLWDHIYLKCKYLSTLTKSLVLERRIKVLRNTNNKVIIKDYWYASNGWKHMIRNSAHVNTCMYSLFLVRHLTRPLQSEGQQAHPHPEVFWGALSRSQPNPFLWCPPGATLRIHCTLLLVCNSSTCI